MHVDPVRDDDGTIVGVANFFYDVAERKIRESDTELKSVILRLALKKKAAELRERQRASLQDIRAQTCRGRRNKKTERPCLRVTLLLRNDEGQRPGHVPIAERSVWDSLVP